MNPTIPRISLVVLLVLLLGLSVPVQEQEAPASTDSDAFVWGRDEQWSRLESDFTQAKNAGCPAIQDDIDSRYSKLTSLLDTIESQVTPPGDPNWDAVELQVQELAARVKPRGRTSREV